jgi:ATP/maltotriose-dependent transcriptional regulator MalT
MRDDATILRGRCLPYGESITFWPLLAIVREAAGIDQDEAGESATAKVAALCGDPEVARRVASALDWSSEELPLPELFWGVRELLEGMARRGPVVVVIDDVHWAAPTLLEMVEHLLERVTDASLLVVCTARPSMLDAHPEWSEGPSATRIVLDRLPDEASAQLLDNMTGGLEVPSRVRTNVLRAAEGNPLFVEQLVSMLTDRGLLVRAGQRWEATADLVRLEIPPSIQALLSARLDGLDAEERGVMDPASVIGLEFPSVAVREITPVPIGDRTTERLSELVRKRLVREEASPDEVNDYRFDHLLIRDAAYAGVLKRSRADLHERYAGWLEASAGARERDEVIGYHLEQAARYRTQLGPMDDRARSLASRASARLAVAGRRAFARGDLPAAVELLRRAHDALPDDDAARTALVPDLAESLMESGGFEEARAIAAQAQPGAADDETRCAEARTQLILLLVDLSSGNEEGWLERAHREVARLLPVFEAAANHVGLATAWRVTWNAQVMALQFDAGFEAAEQIIRHATAAGDVRQQRRGAVAYAICAVQGPTLVPEGIARCEELIESVDGDRRTQAVVQLCLAQLLAMDGHFERARELCATARAVLEELGQRILAASTSTDSGPVNVLAGDLEQAERELRRDLADLETLGETYLRSTVAGLLAHVLVERGDVAESERIAELARELAGPDDVDAQVLWRASLGRCRAQQGKLDEGIDLLDQAVALISAAAAPTMQAQALTDRAIVMASARRPDRAAADLADAVALHEAKGNAVGAAAARAIRVVSDASPV